jgi:dipeptidyl aminopeptidase/acylaminoacyl peptidase
MAISLPGSGASTGPDDFNGPRAVAAIFRAAAFLAQDSRVRPEAIAVYGIGAGAAAALLAAVESPHIRLAAVQDGGYGLEEIFGSLSENERLRMRLRLGGTPKEKPEAYRIRSPIRRLAGLRGPVLILHAKKPRTYPLFQADALAGALRAKGHPHRLIIIPGSSEELNPRLPSIKRHVLPFLREHLESGGNRG